MDNTVKNHFEVIHKKYKDEVGGINKLTGMNKLTRIIVLGPSNSTKNNWLIEFLKRSPNIYTELHIICRNREQPAYDYLEDKLDGFITFYGEDDIPTVDDFNNDGKLKLVVIDDFSADKKLQEKVFSHFFIRGRHKKLTTIYMCHSYFAGCNKMMRLNADYIVILKANSKKDLKMILNDFNIENVDDKKMLEYYNEATKKKGNFLLVDNLNNNLRFNFHEILNK